MLRHALTRRLDPADDRGAVLPLIALVLVVLLTATAFAVDLGMQRVLARDMQAVADVVALDMARRLDGGTRAEVEAQLDDVLAATLARNPDHIGTIEQVDFAAGTTDTDGNFVAIASTEHPDAVQVTVAGRVPFAFTGAFNGPASGPATRGAVVGAAALPPACPAGDPTCTPTGTPGSACIRLGAIALGLDSASSPLVDPLLGDALNLSLVGYESLADVTVTLGDLAAELGAGSPQALAGATVTVRELYAATADVLQQQGDVASATLLNTALSAAVTTLTIQVSDLLAVGHASDAAMDLQLNVLDLVTGAAFIANGTNAIAVPAATVAIPGVTNVSASLVVVQGPVVACDTAIAETSQVTLRLSGTIPGLPLVTVAPSFTLDVDLANATGWVSDLDCLPGPPAWAQATVDGRTVAAIDLDSAIRVEVSLPPLGPLQLPILQVLNLQVGAETTPPANAATATLDTTAFDDQGLSAPQRVGQGSFGLAPLTVSSNVTVAGLPVSPVVAPLLSPLMNGLNAVLGNVLTAVEGPIADQLGLTVNGVDVWALQEPVCAHPVPIS